MVTGQGEFDPRSVLDWDGIGAGLQRITGRDSVTASNIGVSRLNLGTSGAYLYSVVVTTAGADEPNRLVLKVSRPKRFREAQFFRDLSRRVPLETPRVIDLGFTEDRGWVLMEEISARDPLSYTRDDYRTIVQDMARLHAANWGQTDRLGCTWLDAETFDSVTDEVRECLAHIAPSWMPSGLPEAFGNGRLELMSTALANADSIAQPLVAAGLTLVHGDYWFYNILLTGDGRRVMVDWQGPRIWSGFWELAYFINLLMVVGPSEYRELPVPEADILDWYRTSLAGAGIEFTDEQFTAAYRAGSVLHPLIHWLPQLSGNADSDPWATDERHAGVRWFFKHTFERWQNDMELLGG